MFVSSFFFFFFFSSSSLTAHSFARRAGRFRFLFLASWQCVFLCVRGLVAHTHAHTHTRMHTVDPLFLLGEGEKWRWWKAHTHTHSLYCCRLCICYRGIDFKFVCVVFVSGKKCRMVVNPCLLLPTERGVYGGTVLSSSAVCVCLRSSLSLHRVRLHRHAQVRRVVTLPLPSTSASSQPNQQSHAHKRRHRHHATQHVRRIHAERADDASTRTRCEEEGKTGRKFARPLSRSPAITRAASASLNAFLHCNVLFLGVEGGIVVILLSWQMEARREIRAVVHPPATTVRGQAPLLVVWERKATEEEQQVERTVLLHCNSLFIVSFPRLLFSAVASRQAALGEDFRLVRPCPLQLPWSVSTIVWNERGDERREKGEGRAWKGESEPHSTAEEKREEREAKGSQGNSTQATYTHAPYTHT